jgi:hypothetical protein
MGRRWWQYERRPRSQELRGVAYTWLAFAAAILLSEIGEWRSKGLAAASSALAVAVWFFKRARQEADIEADKRS